jgi:hypothetical protein
MLISNQEEEEEDEEKSEFYYNESTQFNKNTMSQNSPNSPYKNSPNKKSSPPPHEGTFGKDLANNFCTFSNPNLISPKRMNNQRSPEDVYPDDELILDTRAHSDMKLLSSTANSVFLGNNSPCSQDNQYVARKLIDRIFDLEVKRDALVKARK